MKSAVKIKKMRLQLALEMREFGALIGVGKQSIWQYEKSMRQPRIKTIRKLLELAKKYKIKATLEDFLE